jgi:MATE family multidrug resistance protein
LHWLDQPAAVIDDAGAFARGIIWGIVPLFLLIVLRQTLQGMSIVRPAVAAIVLGNVANVAANYAFIFGNWGAPALGVRGAAYSTSLSRWVMLVYLVIAARRQLAPYFQGWSAAALDLRGHLHQLRIGVPIGFHNFFELLVFYTVALIIGRLGVVALAGHQIAINLASLSFMVPLGVAGAAATRVGNAIGRGDMAAARRSAGASLLLGVGVMCVFATVFATLPGVLARVYIRDPAVIAMAASLIQIAAVFQIFDGTQTVSAGILRGAGDTALPAGLALVGFWGLGLPVGWLLAFHFDWGPRGLWWGLTLGLASVTVLFLARIFARFRSDITRVGAGRR